MSLAPEPPGKPIPAPGRFLAGMRIRKKLIFLHTFFSLVLAGILAAAVWPGVTGLVRDAETVQARLALRLAQHELESALRDAPADLLRDLTQRLPAGVSVAIERPTAPLDVQLRATARPGDTWFGEDEHGVITAMTIPARGATLPAGTPDAQATLVARARLAEARAAVSRLMVILVLALLAVYALIALALEVFVLPRHVYGPIRRLLEADEAVRAHTRMGAAELIPDEAMPSDELGQIMRSRNATVSALRRHEADLASALAKLESAAADLARKNHLLETAQRNLADADRLASLGIMSAGLAHEMNTPLAVIKGLAEKARGQGGRLDGPESELLLRVTARLERLSESLLDFARARPAPPRSAPAHLRELVDEAWTLVRLDRAVAGRVELENAIDGGLVVSCDDDRMMQVFVNLLRNAADAVLEAPPPRAQRQGATATPRVTVAAERSEREGRQWVSITITDEGPGLDPALVGRLFEPFASTRLDSQGTGLGLAVSEGIVKEHGGLILARNREGVRGAVFEVMVPAGA